MSDLAELEALLEQRAKLDAQIEEIRSNLEAALARINGVAPSAPAPAPPSAPPASQVVPPPPVPVLPAVEGQEPDRCIYFDCEQPVARSSIYCAAHHI